MAVSPFGDDLSRTQQHPSPRASVACPAYDSAVLTLLAVWVVVMGAMRLHDAISFDDGVHVNGLLAALALLAIIAGAGAIVAPSENLEVVTINVWIFTILRGVMLIASKR